MPPLTAPHAHGVHVLSRPGSGGAADNQHSICIEDMAMATCDVCGNEYANSFTVTQGAVTGTFDSFECAIHAMAPRCALRGDRPWHRVRRRGPLLRTLRPPRGRMNA